MPLFDATLDTSLIQSRYVPADSVPDVVEPVIELPSWESGVEPAERDTSGAANPGIIAIAALMAVIALWSLRDFGRVARKWWTGLVKEHTGRENIFDERGAGDIRLSILLSLLGVSGISLLLSLFVTKSENLDMLAFGKVFGITSIAYIYVLVGLHLVGYAFADPLGHRQWLEAHTGGFCVLSLLLVIPVLVGLFNPQEINTVMVISSALYILSRILFIIRGFRIFHTNFYSYFYFILYLCTLEIIPVLATYTFVCAMV